ncbi:DUF4222 domain-containing protein [Klebsiella sp. BIGb0407]|uniref:DUF4222 domain-containing protein n=1 Tax=Klebsiella sp. BIGb0407 TaxID=2940603 RepID=UPI0021689A45|nr:DUF4222 domain-containing protein [Klebsiella sp. BIGb0407]
MEELDRYYIDWRGRTVHVIGYDRQKQWVIFREPGYEHDCMLPVEQFQKKYRRVDE